MKLAEFLKRLVSIRVKNSLDGDSIKEFEWVQNLLIVAGAEYVFNDENRAKVNTLKKHIFSPIAGRTSLSKEITDVLLENKTERYGKVFHYVMCNIDWCNRDKTVADLMQMIVKDEKMRLIESQAPLFTQYNDVLDYINKKIENKEALKYVYTEMFVGYFYHLVCWEMLTHSASIYLYYRPNVSEIVEKFTLKDVSMSPSGAFSPSVAALKNLQNMALVPRTGEQYSTSYIDIVSYKSNQIVLRLFIPPLQNESKSPEVYYQLTFSGLNVAYNSVSNNPVYCQILNGKYVFAINNEMIVFWNLDEDVTNYKVILEHNLNIDKPPILSLSNDNEKFQIVTSTSFSEISISDFTHINTILEFNSNDDLIDAEKRIFLSSNRAIIHDNSKGEVRILIDFDALKLQVERRKIYFSKTLRYCIIQCVDNSYYAIDVENMSFKKILQRHEELSFIQTHSENEIVPQAFWDPKLPYFYIEYSDDERYLVYSYMSNYTNSSQYILNIVDLESIKSEHLESAEINITKNFNEIVHQNLNRPEQIVFYYENKELKGKLTVEVVLSPVLDQSNPKKFDYSKQRYKLICDVSSDKGKIKHEIRDLCPFIFITTTLVNV